LNKLKTINKFISILALRSLFDNINYLLIVQSSTFSISEMQKRQQIQSNFNPANSICRHQFNANLAHKK